MTESTNVNEPFACPEVTRDGGFWIEIPQTASATSALLKAFAVSRMDDPGWQPVWVLCGSPGSGRTALAARLAARARSIATGEPEWRAIADASETMEDAWPSLVREGENMWDHYRTALAKADDLIRFGVGRAPERAIPYASRSDSTAIPGADDAEPVIVARMDHERRQGHKTHGYPHHAWRNEANQASGDPRRTTLAFIDDVEHLVRLSEAKRTQALEEMLDWPHVIRLGHRVTLVLIGSPALADAVETCKPVRRIELLPMEEDGAEGTFAKVCDLVFGDRASGRLSRLHVLSDGLVGRLLHVAHLEGLRAPYAFPRRVRPSAS